MELTEEQFRKQFGNESNFLDQTDFEELENHNDNEILKYAAECFSANNQEQKKGEENMSDKDKEIEDLKSQMEEQNKKFEMMMQMMQNQNSNTNGSIKESTNEKCTEVQKEKEDDDFPFEDEEEDDILDVAKQRENDNIFDMVITEANFKRDVNNKKYLFIVIAPVGNPDKKRKMAIHDKDRMVSIAKNLSSKVSELPGERVKVKVKRNENEYNEYYFSFEKKYKNL